MRPLIFTAFWLTATVFPAIVTVVLRAAPVLAAVVTITAPLPEPPAVFMGRSNVSLARFQTHPAVTRADVHAAVE